MATRIQKLVIPSAMRSPVIPSAMRSPVIPSAKRVGDLPALATTGFSLLELIIVLAILGIIAFLAVPRYKTFQAKARQAEARTTLHHLYTLEETYRFHNNAYQAITSDKGYDSLAGKWTASSCDFSKDGAEILGFKLNPCKPGQNGPGPRYAYTVEINANGFLAKATTGKKNRIIRKCSTPDTFTIDHNHELKQPKGEDALKSCK